MDRIDSCFSITPIIMIGGKAKLLLAIGGLIVLMTVYMILRGKPNRSFMEEELRINRFMRQDVPIIQKKSYTLRSIKMSDYKRGFIDCLNELTAKGDVTESQFRNLLAFMSKNGCYKILVAYDPLEERIIGTGTLFIESKFIRGCVKKGHIEDVVVSKDRRGLGIGEELVKTLIDLSKSMGCYKVALVCDEKNVGFYEKCGLERKEREMVKYH